MLTTVHTFRATRTVMAVTFSGRGARDARLRGS